MASCDDDAGVPVAIFRFSLRHKVAGKINVPIDEDGVIFITS